MPLNMSEFCLNIIHFISNLYVGVSLYIVGLVSIPCMLENDCNDNPICFETSVYSEQRAGYRVQVRGYSEHCKICSI